MLVTERELVSRNELAFTLFNYVPVIQVAYKKTIVYSMDTVNTWTSENLKFI